MKKIAGLIFALMTAVNVAFADSYALKVNGMHCQHCADRLESELQVLEGVDSVTFDLEAKQVMLNLANEQSLQEDVLRKTITDAGFTLVEIESASDMAGDDGAH